MLRSSLCNVHSASWELVLSQTLKFCVLELIFEPPKNVMNAKSSVKLHDHFLRNTFRVGNTLQTHLPYHAFQNGTKWEGDIPASYPGPAMALRVDSQLTAAKPHCLASLSFFCHCLPLCCSALAPPCFPFSSCHSLCAISNGMWRCLFWMT